MTILKNVSNRMLSLFIAFVMVFALFPAFPIEVHAATVTPITGLGVGGLGATYEVVENTGTMTDNAEGTFKVTATSTKGGCDSTSTASSVKVILSNGLDLDATLKFTVVEEGTGTVAYDNKINKDTTPYSATLAPGESVTITVTCPSTNSASSKSLQFSNISLSPVGATYDVTVLYDSALGSVKVGGTTVSSGYIAESVESITLEATTNSGVEFYGWVNMKTGAVLSKATSFTYEPGSDTTIKAAFVSKSSKAWWSVDGKLFDDLNVACTAGSKVVLAANGTLPAGNYTIPSGVTLLIPFDSENTAPTTTPNVIKLYMERDDAGTVLKDNTPTIYRTLTMASGAHITVNGAICVGGSQSAQMDSGYNGCVVGPVGRIHMESNSTITVNDKAFLYAWGYITGSGSVTAESGATVYESFQVTDYRGGDVTSGVATDTTHAVFPMSQYYLQNIEVPLTLKAGAVEKAAMSVTVTLLGVQTSDITVIGSSDAMFTLSSGHIVKDFNESNGRLEFEIEGVVSVSAISMTMQVALGLPTTINTENFNLPIPGHMTVTAKSGSNITMAQDICLLPGSELNIDNGAVCTVAKGVRIIAYSWKDWTSQKGISDPNAQAYFVHPYQHYKRLWYSPTTKGVVATQGLTKDAQIRIDGTIYAAEGAVYTTANGANIYSTGTGRVETTPGTETTTYQLFQTGSDSKTKDFVQIGIKPAALKNADGTYVETAGGGNNTYTYTNGKWVCATHTESTTDTDHACDVCGYTPASDHSYTAVVTPPTCTEQGYTTYTCSVCGHSCTDDETAATGHSFGTDNCKEDRTCTTCGATVAAASGHNLTFDRYRDAGDGTHALIYKCSNAQCFHEESSYEDHKDENKDHVCDECGATGMGKHADGVDNDHACDYCGGDVGETCYDNNKDHKCDECNETTSTCVDENPKDHVCDYEGCQAAMGTHADGDDNDHVCDYCGGDVGETCYDNNKDHKCDECNETTSTCVDEAPKDHVCDYEGCQAAMGTHADGDDNDHLCDYGCGQVADEGCYDADNDGDHDCDECGAENVTACGDSEKDHVCDTDSACAAYSTGNNVHADSATDKDHVCDYCDGEIENGETCTDAETDNDHNCDVCGKIDVTEHSYTSVVTQPTCTDEGYTTHTCNCGDTYTDHEVAALGHRFTDDGYTDCNFCDYSRAAYIGTTNFETLDAAIEAAQNGDTIVVLKQIIVEGNVTWDLTGKTLDVQYINNNDYALKVRGNLTIKGGNFNFANIYGIGVTATGTLTVDGGSFTTPADYYLIGNWGTTTINAGAFESVYCNVNGFGGTTEIKGGTFKITDKEYGSDVFGAVDVLGGNFSTDVTDYCADGYHTVKSGDVYVYGAHSFSNTWTTDETNHWHECACGAISAKGEHVYEDNFDATCDCGYNNPNYTPLVAMIGDVKYASLAEAVAAAKDGEVIVLHADVTLSEKLTVNTKQTWAFGAYTVTTRAVEGNYSIVVKGDLTIESGKIVARGWYGIGVLGTLTVNGGEITYTEYNDYLIGNWGKTVINGGSFNGQYCCVLNNGGTVTINGGTFKTEEKDATGEYEAYDLLADSGLTVKGGTFSKDMTEYCDDEHHTALQDGGYRYESCTVHRTVRENEVVATVGGNGSYDTVEYCACGHELSRVKTETSITTNKFEDDNAIPDSIKDKIDSTAQGDNDVERLENLMVESVIKDKIEEAIQDNDFVDSDNLKDKMSSTLIDVSLQYVDESGEWQKADEEHFPASGKIEIILPIPDGTKLSTHTFFVAHMFTSDAFGEGAGHIEYPEEIIEFVGEDGKEYIKFVVTGLSPITLTAVETDPCADGHDFDEQHKCEDCGYVYGDIDGDGQINSADVAYLNAFRNDKITLDAMVWKTYDTNGDDVIDKNEVQALLVYVLSLPHTT